MVTPQYTPRPGLTNSGRWVAIELCISCIHPVYSGGLGSHVGANFSVPSCPLPFTSAFSCAVAEYQSPEGR